MTTHDHDDHGHGDNKGDGEKTNVVHLSVNKKTRVKRPDLVESAVKSEHKIQKAAPWFGGGLLAIAFIVAVMHWLFSPDTITADGKRVAPTTTAAQQTALPGQCSGKAEVLHSG